MIIENIIIIFENFVILFIKFLKNIINNMQDDSLLV